MQQLKYYFHDKPSSLVISHIPPPAAQETIIHKSNYPRSAYLQHKSKGGMRKKKKYKSFIVPLRTLLVLLPTYIGSFYYGNPFPARSAKLRMLHLVALSSFVPCGIGCRLVQFRCVTFILRLCSIYGAI